jgi:hypothetical protein
MDSTDDDNERRKRGGGATTVVFVVVRRAAAVVDNEEDEGGEGGVEGTRNAPTSPIAEMADDASRKVAASDSFIVTLLVVVGNVCCVCLGFVVCPWMDGFPKNKYKMKQKEWNRFRRLAYTKNNELMMDGRSRVLW